MLLRGYETVFTTERLDEILPGLSLASRLTIDTETEGDETYRLYEEALALAPEIDKALAAYDNAVALYKATYKRGNSVYRTANVDPLENMLKALEDKQKDLRKRAMASKSGLHFWENQLGCLQIDNGTRTYLIRPEIITQDQSKKLEKIFNGVKWLVLHNGQFDWKQLYVHLSIELDCLNLWDIHRAEFLITNGKGLKCDLGNVVARRLGMELNKDKDIRVGHWRGEWSDDMCTYGALDVQTPSIVMDQQKEEIEVFDLMYPQEHTLYERFRLECELIPAVARMELQGIAVDREYLKLLTRWYRKLTDRHFKILIQKLKEGGFDNAKNFNPNAPVQVQAALRACGIQVKDTRAKTLKKHRKEPVVNALLAYREANTVFTRYLIPFKDRAVEIERGHFRIFGNFNPCGAEEDGVGTGRFSSTEPNLQNLKATYLFRRLFIAAPGNTLVDGDLSGIEMRILGASSKDPILLNVFAKELDVHTMAASKIFGVSYDAVTKKQRGPAKNIQFGIVYGKTSFGLSEDLEITQRQAQGFLDRYFMNYTSVERYLNGIVAQAYETGFVRTDGGFVRYLPDLDLDATMARLIETGIERGKAYGMARNKRNHAERAAKNTPIQGNAAEGMKRGIILFYRWIKKFPIPPCELIMTVHDQLTVECAHHNAVLVQTNLERCLREGVEYYVKTVPVKIGDGASNWMPTIMPHWGLSKEVEYKETDLVAMTWLKGVA